MLRNYSRSINTTCFKEKKLSAEKLEATKNKILENDFSFRIPYKIFANKTNDKLICK